MATRRQFLVEVAGGSAALFSGTASRWASADEREHLAVVVAKSSPVDAVALRELKRLYLGEAVLRSDGKHPIPLSQAALTPDRVAFDRVVLGMSPDEVARYWIDRKIRGQSGPPKSVPSVELLRRVVARVDGALGYLRLSELTDDIKVVRVDGLTPQDRGYPLVV